MVCSYTKPVLAWLAQKRFSMQFCENGVQLQNPYWPRKGFLYHLVKKVHRYTTNFGLLKVFHHLPKMVRRYKTSQYLPSRKERERDRERMRRACDVLQHNLVHAKHYQRTTINNIPYRFQIQLLQYDYHPRSDPPNTSLTQHYDSQHVYTRSSYSGVPREARHPASWYKDSN